jgi:hypothetical protein
LKPVVKHLGGSKSLSILLTWKELNVNLVLNFEPLVRLNNPIKPWVISHFQAIPFGHRSFGYLICKEDNTIEYQTLYENEVEIRAYPKQISIPESSSDFLDIRPTACYVFEKTITYQESSKLIIKSIYN